MPKCSDRWIPWVLGITLALCTPTRAASVVEEAQRLDDLLFFVGELDRGWDPLIAEIGTTLGSLDETPRTEVQGILRVRDEAYWTRAETLFASGGDAAEERCIELYRVLSADALDAERRTSSTRRLADIFIRRGEALEAAGDEDGALGAYLEAVDHAPDYDAGYTKVGALGVRQARRKADAQDWDGALKTLADVLARIERGLPEGHPSLVEARSQRAAILSGTGILTVHFLGNASRLERVRGPKTDFRAGQLLLAAQDGGKAPPTMASATPRRVRVGRFRVTASGQGGPETWPADVEVRADGGTVTVPLLIPVGMVVVPAAGGAPAFLCDRTEVSNVAYQEFARSSGARSAGGPPGNAVCGVPFADAKRFAEWSGKDLPTDAQWTHAAFGAPYATQPLYPWGSQAGTPGTHFFGGRSEPGPVNGCSAGASGARVLNLAGNVFEWLADGWFIGGGFVETKFRSTVGYAQPVNGQPSWEADFLRDKVPTAEVHRTLQDPAMKNKYDVYRVTDERTAGFLRQAGFRCVVPLE